MQCFCHVPRGSKGQIYRKLSFHSCKYYHLGWTLHLKLDFLSEKYNAFLKTSGLILTF